MNLRRPETIVKRAMPEQTPELSGTDWLILAGLLIATLLTLSGWVSEGVGTAGV